MCDLHRARFVNSQRPTRTRMRQRLDRCEAAAWLLSEELASRWVREFLEADPYDPLPDLDQTIRILEDLADRAHQAGASAALVTEAGVTKAGSGRARPVAAVSAQTIAPSLFWRPGSFFVGLSRCRGVAKPKRPPKRIGGPRAAGRTAPEPNPLASWRYHFQLARENKMKTITAEYRRHLVETTFLEATARLVGGGCLEHRDTNRAARDVVILPPGVEEIWPW